MGPEVGVGILHERHDIFQERHGWTSCDPRGDESHQTPFPPQAPGAPWPQQPWKPQPSVEEKEFQCDITEAEENGASGSPAQLSAASDHHS